MSAGASGPEQSHAQSPADAAADAEHGHAASAHAAALAAGDLPISSLAKHLHVSSISIHECRVNCLLTSTWKERADIERPL